jgi:hypothetical protein
MNANRLGMVLREPTQGQVAPQDVCLFQNANFSGWKYCSNLTGLQELPTRYRGQATSMTVPDGYLVKLYQRVDRSGTQCVFYGQVGQVARDCDNMTAAISLEADPEWPAKQAAEQARQAEAREQEQAQQQEATAQRERELEEARIREFTTPTAMYGAMFCIYPDPNMRGAPYCSSQNKNLFSPEFRANGSSVKVPEGFRLFLYERPNRTGAVCQFLGDVDFLGDGCDNMASAYAYEPDPGAGARRAAAQAEQAAEARNAELIIARRRQTEIETQKCLATLSTDDGDFNILNPLAIPRALSATSRCANEAEVGYVGNSWNDDFEMVKITSAWVRISLYEDANFSGRHLTLTCGLYELIDEPENEISSYKIEILDAPVECSARSFSKKFDWDR